MLFAAAAPIASAPSASAAVRIDDVGGVLVVPVTVNGKGPFHFILDTGAGITVITPQLARTLSLKGAASGQIGGTGEKQVAMQTLALDRIRFGDVERSKVATAVVPLPRSITYQGRYGSIDGILGYSFFKGYALKFNVAHRRAELVYPNAFRPPHGIRPLPVTFAEDAIPTVKVKIAGARGAFDLDSGSNAVTIVTQAFARAHDIGNGYAHARGSAYQGVGGTVGTLQVRVPALQVGSVVVHDAAADISSAKAGFFVLNHLDGSIGYDVLRRFAVTVDYAHARAYFEPQPNFDDYRPLTGTGITPERDAAGNLRVVTVLPGSPAARFGIVAGDTIVAVNGRAAKELSLGDYASATNEIPGSVVTYTLVSSDGKRRTVEVKTVDLLPP